MMFVGFVLINRAIQARSHLYQLCLVPHVLFDDLLDFISFYGVFSVFVFLAMQFFFLDTVLGIMLLTHIDAKTEIALHVFKVISVLFVVV